MSMDTSELKIAQGEALAVEIKPLLAGFPPDVVGLALAELLATLLAGFIILGDPEGTERVRDEVLERHVEAVRRLAPLIAAELHSSSG